MKVLTSKFDTKYDTAPFSRSKRRFFRLFREESLAKAEIDQLADKTNPHLRTLSKL
jgi:hypothetical protein